MRGSINGVTFIMSFNLRRSLNILAVVVTIAMNSLANIIPFNGQNTGQISDLFKVFFVPAGYVFSIWGLIYIGFVAFAVYQALPSQKDNARIAAITPLFLISCVANVAWLLLWHYNQFPLTLVFMLILLGSLIAIYVRLGIGERGVSNGAKWCVNIPFSVYLGWITVATVANFTSVLDFVRWNGFGISDPTWAIIMIGVAAIVGGLMAWTRGDVAYLLVLVWAFVGIAVKQAATRPVANSALIAAALMAAAAVAAYYFRHRTVFTRKAAL